MVRIVTSLESRTKAIWTLNPSTVARGAMSADNSSA